MRTIISTAIMALGVAGLADAVEAAPRCTSKSADGTGPNEKVARFQAYEGVLKSIGLSTWSHWMLDGTTPGYRVGRLSYVCTKGAGLGVSCRSRATVCKT